ncbi:MAG: GFA family protein [Pseudomonadales bacterium]
MSATGKCLCGAVRFTADGVEPHVHACHCSMCRAWSGASMLAATVGSVAFDGEENLVRFDSSEWGARGFCGRCGSNLFYHLKPADTYMMCMGAFDDQSAFELAGEIYIDAKPPGYAFSGEHPRQTGEEFLASLPQG